MSYATTYTSDFFIELVTSYAIKVISGVGG